MRTGALALLLFMAACGRSGGDANQAGASGNASADAAPGDERETAATLALAASGPGNCSARWEGQPATPAQVLERSSAVIERAITEAGGVTNMTDATTPAVAVTAPASLPFACADTFLAPLNRVGVHSLLLTPDGGQEAALADFSLTDIPVPPPSVVLALGAGGRLTWNGEAITVDAIPERMRALSGVTTSDVVEAPAGELELRPAREATFGQVHAVLRAVRGSHFRVALLLPSVQPRRPAAARPATPPPVPPAGNQAAPRP